MANTYYDSELTAEEIEAVLEAINGILTPANNGKVLAISNGKLEARSVQWGGGEPTIEPLSVVDNGTYTAPSGVDGYSPITVNVPGSSAVVQPLSVTQNGTYNPPSGVDGYAPVTVNVSGGSGGSGVLVSPAYQGVSYGYVIRSGQEFWSYPNQAWYLSAFEVQANHKYAIYIGETVGIRRRASFFAGKTIADFMPYITQGDTETAIYSGGIWLAPFTSGTDDTGNALTGRIIYTPQSNGIILYVSDYNISGSPATTPAYCVDMDATGGGSNIKYAGDAYFGDYDGTVASSLSCTITGAVGAYAVLVIMHRDTITLPSGWVLIDNKVNPKTSATGNINQEISIYKKQMTEASETVVITQASSVRMCATSFIFGSDVNISYLQTLEMDDYSTYRYTVPPQNGPVLFCMSNVYAGNANVNLSPVNITIGKDGAFSKLSLVTVRQLASIINSPIDSIFLFNTTAAENDKAINRAYLYSLS